MVDAQLGQVLRDSIHELLVWVGFGTLVGLSAKAIMPGRDPGGTVVTLMMGIVGCVIGCGSLMFFCKGVEITPISPLGFCAATGGGVLLLAFYRLFTGSLIADRQEGENWLQSLRRRKRRKAMIQDL